MSAVEPTKQLHVKSFFAASIPEAMELARREFGPDALLLNARQAPPEARHLGECEVVFGGAPESVPAPPAAASEDGVVGLRQQVDEIRHLLSRMAAAPAYSRSRLEIVEQALVDAGVEPILARDIDDCVRQRVGKRGVLEIGKPRSVPDYDPKTLVAETQAEIESRFDIQPELGRVAAFVGPPGSGKTSAMVKLAIRQGLALGRPVRLVSIDTQRIGAAEQLKTYATILGVPFQAVESTAALEIAIDAAPSNSLLLIDTPGYSATLLQDLGGELAGFLSRRQDIDTHLVLTASMRAEDLTVTAERFATFRPSKLLFTRLDETTSFAAMFCQAVRQQKPLSFYCHGQSIPEDLEPASKERIVESLVRQLPEALVAVA
ncbi:MAG TPA: hypothetical protein VLY04_16200 [Bryobacteraceae bacterium]|nr:hypothetical protein [Bryobacteraceae bacterium]